MLILIPPWNKNIYKLNSFLKKENEIQFIKKIKLAVGTGLIGIAGCTSSPFQNYLKANPDYAAYLYSISNHNTNSTYLDSTKYRKREDFELKLAKIQDYFKSLRAIDLIPDPNFIEEMSNPDSTKNGKHRDKTF